MNKSPLVPQTYICLPAALFELLSHSTMINLEKTDYCRAACVFFSFFDASLFLFLFVQRNN